MSLLPLTNVSQDYSQILFVRAQKQSNIPSSSSKTWSRGQREIFPTPLKAENRFTVKEHHQSLLDLYKVPLVTRFKQWLLNELGEKS